VKRGPKGGIYSIHLFDHRLGSPFLIIRFVLKEDNLGKRGPKGGIYSIHLFDHRLGSPFLL